MTTNTIGAKTALFAVLVYLSRPRGKTIVTTAQRTERVSRKQWLTLFVLCLAVLIAIVDITVVNVTIPAIRAEFNVELSQVEWMIATYALVFAAFIITWGKLGDQFGRRRMFIAGLVTFVVGSLIVGFAPSLGIIILGRFIQGMGAAMVSPATLSLLSSAFSGNVRGVAFGLWGATAGAAGAVVRCSAAISQPTPRGAGHF